MNTNCVAGLNHLLFVKRSKREKQKSVYQTELLQLGQFVNFKLCMNSMLQKPRKHCKCPLFTFRSTSQGVKYRLFLSKHPLKAVQLNYWKFELGSSKKFQIFQSTKDGCLHISNIINSKFTEFIKQQPHEGSNHFLSSTLIEGGGVISHIELFQQVQCINFYIYMTSRLQNPRKPL